MRIAKKVLRVQTRNFILLWPVQMELILMKRGLLDVKFARLDLLVLILIKALWSVVVDITALEEPQNV